VSAEASAFPGRFSDSGWLDYEQYKAAVIENTPPHLCLRDKDRYLWGKSFYDDASKAIR
jgi:hypothetical protein